MKAILCEYIRNTCNSRKKDRRWMAAEIAKVYKKRKIVKFVMIDGMPKTKNIKSA